VRIGSLAVTLCLFVLVSCQVCPESARLDSDDLVPSIEHLADSVDSLAMRGHKATQRTQPTDTMLVVPDTLIIPLCLPVITGPTTALVDTIIIPIQSPQLEVTALVHSLDSLTVQLATIKATGIPQTQSRWTLAPVGAQLVTLIVVVITWIGSLKANAYLKGQDMVLTCHERFAELMTERARICRNPQKERSILFYRKFWFLHHHEFSLWRQGLVPKEVYKFWLGRRLAEFRTEKCYLGSPPSLTYEDGWRLVSKDYAGTDFKGFIDSLFSDAAGADEIRRRDTLIKTYGPIWWRQLLWLRFLPGNLHERRVESIGSTRSDVNE